MENSVSIVSDAPKQNAEASLRPSRQPSERTGIGAATWMVIVVLLSLLIATDFVAYLGWTLADGIELSTAGYVAMGLGVLFSLAVGSGLMALVFYSSRSGYDEPPVFITSEKDPKRAGRFPSATPQDQSR
jgi:hypothetical protein